MRSVVVVVAVALLLGTAVTATTAGPSVGDPHTNTHFNGDRRPASQQQSQRQRQQCGEPQSTTLEVAERFQSSMALELRLPGHECRITRVKAPKDAILTVNALAGVAGNRPQELIQFENGVVTVASGWDNVCGMVTVLVTVPLGMELSLTAGTTPVVLPACSDGADNDGDGLRDWPLDPGCDGPADDVEGGDPPTKLAYEFNETDGRLKNLNWTDHRIVWDEVGRIGYMNTKSPKTPWVRLDSTFWLHGSTCHCGGGCGCGSTITIRPNPQSNYTETVSDRVGVDITTKFVSANPGTDTVVVQTDTPTLEVVDTVHFSGDTMYVSMAMTNKNFTTSGEPISAQIPIFLGSLALGNMLKNGTTAQASPGVWVLNPGAGGWNQSLDACHSNNPAVPDGCVSAAGVSYPDNDAFSPVAVLADNSVTAGFQFLGVGAVSSTSTLSISVSKRTTHFDHGGGKSGGILGASGMVNVVFVNKTVSLTLAISFARSMPDDSAWEATLAPYKKDFEATVGGVRYCPTGPFFELAVEAGRLDPSTHRLPPLNLSHMTTPHVSAPHMHDYGIDMIGFWGLALNSRYESLNGENEFNPVTEFVDPNVVEHDNSLMGAYLASWSAGGVAPFWFQRPCSDILAYQTDGSVLPVTVEYTSAPPGFVVTRKGNFTWIHDMDGSYPAGQLQRNLDRMEHWINLGVRGFYFDEARCTNIEHFVEEARKKWPNIFTVMEGATDRFAVLSASIPIFKEGTYKSDNSMLMKWLLPDATYYSGEIDQGLNVTESMHQMQKGLGVIIPPQFSYYNSPPTQDWCEVIDQSAKNWAKKKPPAGMSCPRPFARQPHATCAPTSRGSI